MASRKTKALLAFLPFALIAAAFPVAFASRAADGSAPIPVDAVQISEFKSGAGNRFGQLEFLGGLVMASAKGELGAVSSIRMLPDHTSFISVMDTGHWATGRIVRDASGRLSGIADYRITQMRDEGNFRGNDRGNFDAEGLLIAGDRLYVSFERYHRILAYPYPGFETAMPLERQLPVTGPWKLRGNGGMEALLKAPQESPLEGALFYIAERTYNGEGNFIAGVQSGPKKGVFYVERSGDYDVTDGVVLKDGTFLLLERKFSLASGIGMRIRRFRLTDIAPDATIRGEIVMEADFSHQIDNMEGLDAFEAEDGSTHLIVTSDDNHSLLERNLMLEFRMID